MKAFRKGNLLRFLASLLGVSFLTQIVFPTVSYALTSGPSQPEFSSFEPVATTGMVNQFTGDFTYNLPVLNVPGPNGGGYAMSLSYHSGVSMEEDASWVGYGWTLNPGAINRSKKGIPDDYKGTVEKLQKMEKNVTVGMGPSLSADFFTFFAPSIGRSIRYNNYKGYSRTTNVSASFMEGLVSVGYSFSSDGSKNFDVSVNPMALVGRSKRKKAKKEAKEAQTTYKTAKKNSDKATITNTKATLDAAIKNTNKSFQNEKLAKASNILSGIGSYYGKQLCSNDITPLSLSEYKGVSYSGNLNFGGTPSLLEIAIRGGLWGYYNVQKYPSDTETPTALGYRYSGSGSGMMDYSMEKENVYSKKDFYLPIPFSNPDQYMVTGEGLGGSFRFHSTKAMHFSPEIKQNQTLMFTLDMQAQAGFNIGLGSSSAIGAQFSSSTTGKGGAGNGAANYYFKYDGDKSLDESEPFLEAGDGAVSANPNGFYNGTLKNKEITSIGRSSYIGYTLNSDIASNSIFAYDKSTTTSSLVERGGSEYSNLVGEIATYNENGNRYVYGLPVYCKNDETHATALPYPHGYRDPISKVIGSLRTEVENSMKYTKPYAFSYLLTQINTPDYIDRTLNGPTDDDFGGWTKFNYEKMHGTGKAAWYDWRMPYGDDKYRIDRGSLSDPKDDMAGYSKGEKELYYLSSIETKTHIAKFVTSARKDGRSNNAQDLKKLDRILLYAKNPENPSGNNNKLLQIIHFNYAPENQGLCKNIPNTSSAGGGKLTLKKVWFEYEGIVNSRIAPYEFDYSYKTLNNSSNQLPATNFRSGSNLENLFPTFASNILNYSSLGGNNVMNENPDYEENNLDAWGNWAYDGKDRNRMMRPWAHQGKRDASKKFDPAAWNLKTITLPSGAQILVQYEEHTYSHVQNKKACSMAPLQSGSTPNGTTIKINAKDVVSFDPSIPGTEKQTIAQEIANLILTQYGPNGSDRLYYKFLYSLENGSGTSIDDCGVEYIDGYAKVGNATADMNGVITISFDTDDTPREVCQQFYSANRTLAVDGGCHEAGPGDTDPVSGLWDLLGKYGVDYQGQIESSCAQLILAQSYVRVPVKTKRAGGIRVSRIMMYDPGFNSEEETLYGTEYIYEDQNGASWGVALSEPDREENPMVTYMQGRTPTSWLKKILAGDQKDQFEGPLGETLLPNPSVAYSRVIANPILPEAYKGKSPGFNVYEYFTVLDFPSVKVENTSLNKTDIANFSLPLILATISVKDFDISQGYSFITNDMHGKMKRTATYSGYYDRTKGVAWDVSTSSGSSTGPLNTIASEERYEYTQPGETVSVLKADRTIGQAQLGREEDMVYETHGVTDYVDDAGFNFNMSIGFPYYPPVPIFQYYMYPTLAYSESIVNSHETTRLIHYPAILKKITSKKNGTTSSVENKVFDYATGEPITTITSDEFDDMNVKTPRLSKTIQYELPAHYTVPAFQAKYKEGEGHILSGILSISNCSNCEVADVTATGSAYGQLSEGDIVYASQSGNYFVAAVLEKPDPNDNKVYLDILKTNAQGVLSGSFNTVRLLESGNSNRLKLMSGNITAFGSELHKETGQLKHPFFANNTIANVISASATVYSDKWTMTDFIREKYGLDASVGNANYSHYLAGERGKWRIKDSYVYKGELSPSTGATGSKNFNSGLIQNFGKFNYELNNNDLKKWLRTSRTTHYSPNGNALEEQNVLGIYSAVQFAHQDNLPVVTVSNASYSQVGFTSYEDNLSSDFSSSSPLIKDKKWAHSGNNCLQVNEGIQAKVLSGSLSLVHTGSPKNVVKARFWGRAENQNEPSLQVSLIDKPTGANELAGDVTILARTGLWCLYEATFDISDYSYSVPQATLHVKNMEQQKIFVDDVRILPESARMNCYVYDKASLKLLASFDDQHFGLYYQYNLEGKLVRKMVETEKGMKTISETHYNTPLKARNP